MASSSACVNTGVQQASVPSKIFSHSARVLDLNVDVKDVRRAGQVFLSSRGPVREEAGIERPLRSTAKNWGSIAPLEIKC